MAKGWSATEWTALIAVLLGALIEFAPFLLANVSPALASTAPVQFGVTVVASNQLLGGVFILFGLGLYFFATRKRRRG